MCATGWVGTCSGWCKEVASFVLISNIAKCHNCNSLFLPFNDDYSNFLHNTTLIALKGIFWWQLVENEHKLGTLICVWHCYFCDMVSSDRSGAHVSNYVINKCLQLFIKWVSLSISHNRSPDKQGYLCCPLSVRTSLAFMYLSVASH
jgi:hypothetical protein